MFFALCCAEFLPSNVTRHWLCWPAKLDLIDAVQAFDDCTTVASIFKLLDSFEGLLDRGVIAADLERKHLDLVRGYGQDLKEVADMFRETKDSPPLNKNAAPHSGRVTWVRGLKERVGGECATCAKTKTCWLWSTVAA